MAPQGSRGRSPIGVTASASKQVALCPKSAFGITLMLHYRYKIVDHIPSAPRRVRAPSLKPSL